MKVVDILVMVVNLHPYIYPYLNRAAKLLVIARDLVGWYEACLERLNEGAWGGVLVPSEMRAPDGLVMQIEEMLRYTKTEEEIAQVFKDGYSHLLAFKDLSYYDLMPNRSTDYVYTEGDDGQGNIVISETEIDAAIDRWDVVMPEFEGILDAEIDPDLGSIENA